MNYAENGRNPLSSVDGVEGCKPDRFDKSDKVRSRPVSNWAWENPQGHYDWMDSQAPFASLD
jgi:hypothetical protein